MGEDELAVLQRALDLSGIGFTLVDPRLEDFPLVYVNRSFLAMTGYTADEVMGRNCRFLQGPDTDPGPDRQAPARDLRRSVRDRRVAQLPQGRHAVLERGPHRPGARRPGRGRPLRRRPDRRHGAPGGAAAAVRRAGRGAAVDVPGRGESAAGRLTRSPLDAQLAHASVGSVPRRRVPGLRGPPRRGAPARGGGQRPRGGGDPARAPEPVFGAYRGSAGPGGGHRRGGDRRRIRAGQGGDDRSAQGTRDDHRRGRVRCRWARTGTTAPTNCSSRRTSRTGRRSRSTTRACTRTSVRWRARCRWACCRRSCRCSTASTWPLATGPPATGA